MGFNSVFPLIALTIVALIAPGFAAAAGDDITLNRYCPMLQSAMRSYDEDSNEYRSLFSQHKRICDTANGVDGFSKTLRELNETPDPALDRPREVLSAGDLADKARDGIQDAGQDREALYHQCKMVCAQSEENCRGATGNARSVATQEYNRIYGLTGGNEASVNQACNSVSVYRSTVDSEAGKAASRCNDYRQQCQNTCQEADQRARTVTQNACSAPGGSFRQAENCSMQRMETRWMTANQQAGEASAAAIPRYVDELRQQFNNDAQALQTACQNAKNALQQQKKDDKQAKDDEKKQQNGTQQALGNALQSLGSALANQPAVTPPLGIDTSTPPTFVQPQVTDGGFSGMTSAVKNTNGFNSAVNPSGDPLMLGDDLDGLPGHQPSRLSRMPQQPGGAGAGVGAGGGGSAAGANNRNARRGGRSRFDTDVLKGAQGGAGAAGARGGANGYPDEAAGLGGNGRGKGRAAADGAGGNARMVSLQKFLPSRMQIRREVANTVGPDGITGPHTDQFKKIRLRYNDTVLDNGF